MKKTEKRPVRLTEKWAKTWSVQKKIYMVVILIIISMTVIAIAASTLFSVRALATQNQQYVSEQLRIMTEECDANLKQYKTALVSMVLDESVQDFCGETREEQANAAVGDVYRLLLNMLNIQSNVNFIAVLDQSSGKYVYNGNVSLSESNFEEVYQEDYEAEKRNQREENVVFSFSNRYFRGKKYTLTAYFPVYSVNYVNKKTGMLVMNLDDNILEQLQKKRQVKYSEMFLIDRQGKIVSGNDSSKIGQELSYGGNLQGTQGNLWENGSLIHYAKVGEWDYYLIYVVPFRYFYENSFGVVRVLLLSMLVVMVVAVVISGKLTGRLYGPVNKIIQKMNDVTEGNLGTRIEADDMDSDSQKLAQGFNLMMDEIDSLIDRVKEEQEQLNQMRLNSLQSQIQPHFLYNTLECIHWQAVTAGNRKISTMVKALAQYYRICLSRGEDVISVERELEHVRNYVIIQNMRYGDIIQFHIQVDERYLNMQIPKITLQPLVENSIYHGIRVREGRTGHIRIYTEPDGTDFYLIVEDDGEGMTGEQAEEINSRISVFDREIGYGINNVNKRIELMFGEQYGLRFCLNPGGGVSVRIKLPDRMEGV